MIRHVAAAIAGLTITAALGIIVRSIILWVL